MRYWIVLFGFVALLLTSCQPAKAYDVAPDVHAHQLKQISQEGVHVVQEGLKWHFIIPSDQLFQNDSEVVEPPQDAMLKKIARFILTFEHPEVHIVGYSDNSSPPSAEKMKTLNQARAVAAFLWNHGVAVHDIKVRGAGSDDAKATNKTPAGRAANRRMEIVLIGHLS